MNLKASYLWQMRDHKKSIIIYYFVLICVSILMFISTNKVLVQVLSQESAKTLIAGFDLITVVFLFVAGLCSFKENFGMLMQNSISRKTIFIGRILTAVSIAFGLAVVDRIFQIICNLIFSRDGISFCSDFYTTFYSAKVGETSAFAALVGGFLLSFCLYLSILALGYSITILFYRLNKGGKIAVGVGVPVTCTIIFPFVDTYIFQEEISDMIGRFIDFAFGFTKVRPQNLMIASIIFFVVISMLSWLLMKKAALKEV